MWYLPDLASTLQQFGIKYTSVGKAGFITTLYIIFVPMFGIFLKKKVAPVVWAAAGMAAVGMYLLCMTESLRLGAGDIMVFLCAIAFAIQIIRLIIMQRESMERWYPVSSSQCAVSSAASGRLSGDSRLSDRPGRSGSTAVCGVLSCGVGYTLQIVGQKA